ncbi:Predicted dehydrogenase [Pustulibacterium marinum]|uniref:Predicted dehydrogenase n=1 Tax=Pustulibacterium marinum TaxID=1224947 RepID=A0A1I7I7M9_9FLAO|nr:Gfo/Idh/MocA family oxidoreductase [Pustulibacterium marinum]SFU68982.1 Predicted dehydrogenase [Pustulibacterium marinum]
MRKKLKLGILGGGGNSLIGVLHRVAAYMYEHYEIVGGAFHSKYESSLEFAKNNGLPTDRIYKNIDDLIAKEMALPETERMDVVSVVTPNFLHFDMVKKLLDNNFHVICEKPLTTTYQEAKILKKAIEGKHLVFAVTHTYTGYPMVREMRKLVESGRLGTIQKVDVQYYQGWINPIIHDVEKRKTTWHLDPEKSGKSSCLADIGVHAFNMIEFTTGLKVDKVLSDLNYLYDDNPMDIDGTVLLRFSKNVKGVLRSSQVATGEENGLSIKIYGDKAGMKWEQEDPNFLYLMEEDKPLQVLKPGHAYNSELSLNSVKLPPGHPEGIFDAMGNIYLGVAKAIKGEPYDSGEFPTLTDGVRGMNFIESAMESHSNGNIWVAIDNE